MNVSICLTGPTSEVLSFLERIKSFGSEYVDAVHRVRPQIFNDNPSKENTVYISLQEYPANLYADIGDCYEIL